MQRRTHDGYVDDSVDGYGLQSFSQGAGISDWIVDGSRLPPSEYIQCIKDRAAVLPNNLGIPWYHPEINTYCDSRCGAFECLDHIFQVCPRTQHEESKWNIWKQRHSYMDDKQESRWILSSEGLCDCNRLQLRGVISSKSYSSWHGLGFSRSMLMNLSTAALSDTYRMMWKHRKQKPQKRWRKRVGL